MDIAGPEVNEGGLPEPCGQGVDVFVGSEANDLLLDGPILDTDVDQVGQREAKRLACGQQLLAS